MLNLTLGTAQFDMSYGVARTAEKIDFNQIEEILNFAYKNGVNTLDTAIHYGNTEEILGEIGVSDWNIITKIHSVNFDTKDPYGWVIREVENSLNKLNIDKLHGILLHETRLLSNKYGELIWKALDAIKTQKLSQNIGISIYDPSEISKINQDYSFDIIQAPFNVLDKRIESSGLLEEISKKNKELHVRSIFLQGLLLMDPSSRPSQFNRWNDVWSRWEEWLNYNNSSPLEACINFACSNHRINKVIVGVDSLSQIKKIISTAALQKKPMKFPDIQSIDEDLINPSNWK